MSDNKAAILRVLAVHGTSTTPEIADRAAMHRATVRNNLAGMARPTIGWVQRSGSEEAGYLWAITPAGRAVLAEREAT